MMQIRYVACNMLILAVVCSSSFWFVGFSVLVVGVDKKIGWEKTMVSAISSSEIAIRWSASDDDVQAPMRTIFASSRGEQLSGLKVGLCRIGQWGYQRSQKISSEYRTCSGEKKFFTLAIFIESSVICPQKGANISQMCPHWMLKASIARSVLEGLFKRDSGPFPPSGHKKISSKR